MKRQQFGSAVTRSRETGKAMPRSIRMSVAILVTGVFSAIPTGAGAETPLEKLSLDTYYHWSKRHTPEVISKSRLPTGLYVATVTGTFSYWSAKYLKHPHPTRRRPWTMICGTLESAPLFASGGGTGPVGMDPEFVFGRPWDPTECAKYPLPKKWTGFQTNTGLVGWSHPSALNLSYPARPTPTHTYEYALKVRRPRHIAFRFRDNDTQDNYGTIEITLRQATAADCAGKRYKGFGLTTEAECLAEIAG